MSGQRRNLVIVRAGRSSLHKNWFARAEPNWDLVVSAYEPLDASAGEGARALVLHPGGKWNGLYRTLMEFDWRAYERIWLPDDDLDMDAASINRMFDMAERYNLAVAQPSLSRSSYYTHFLFSTCPRFKLRYTNYIEIMAPCLTRDLLAAVLDDFADTMSGFGLDYLWCRLPQAGAYRAAIIDEVAMHHTRPLGRVLQASIARAGRTPQDEEEKLKRVYGITHRTSPIVYAAIDREGRTRTGRAHLAGIMAAAYLMDLRQFRESRAVVAKVIQLVRRQLTKPLDLSVVARTN